MARTIDGDTGDAPPARTGRAGLVVLALALVLGIALVELGAREPTGAGSLSRLPLPEAAQPMVERLRARPLAGIDDPRAAAIVSGVAFGRTEHVDAAAEEAFLSSGLWHLLAASGQNVALVAACCVLAARAAGGSRVAGAVLALAAIPAYVAVVGGGASIVRAGIMGELLVLAWIAGQRADAWRVLLLAATVICWAWPGSHRLLGFQLSFACVVALLACAEPIQRRLEAGGLGRWLAAAASATIACSLATAPILYLRTGAAPLAGAVANLVAVPLAGAILVVGLAGSLLAMVAPAFAAPLLHVAGLLGALLLAIAERAATLPLAQTSSSAVAIGVPVAALATRLAPARRRRRAGAALAAIVLAWVLLGIAAARVPALEGLPRIPGVPVRHAPPAAGVLRVAALDVGQGDATLLTLDGHALLVDVGPPGGRVVERARAAGAGRVEAVVLTHDSLDHRGGLDAAVAGLRPGRLVIPRGALGDWRRVRRLGLPVEEACAGDELALAPPTRVLVLHPPCDRPVPDRTGDRHNDNAMVLLVEHEGVRTLLSSDAEAPAVLPLDVAGGVDVLRVAHHGSRDEQLPDLLAGLRPAVALVSVGADNTYGHPAPPTLAALAAAGARTVRTDEHGSIVLDVAGGRVRLR